MANVQSRRSARMGRSHTGTVAALDIGCSKITCLIGRNDGSGPRAFRILGAGRQQSRGFTGGTITDMEGLERSIRLAVEDAEREAGEQITDVMLGITGRAALRGHRAEIRGQEPRRMRRPRAPWRFGADPLLHRQRRRHVDR
jgi:hypothetical protein